MDLTVRIIRSVDYQNDARWNYKNCLYPYNTLYFILGGDGHVRIDETVTPLRAGYVYLIPPNRFFDCWCDSHICKLYVDVSVETMPGRDIFAHLSGVLEAPYPVEATRALILANQPDYKHRLNFRGQLEQAIALFIDAGQELLRPDMLRFRTILDDMALNLSAHLRIGEIARKHGWHPSALSRAFKQSFHCSLKHYLERLLVSKLREELILSDKSLKELAAQYRFCDAYYLSAFFKKHIGLSPDRYRRTQAEIARKRTRSVP
jgi:AraC-like DNA-binding protein